MNKWFRRAVGTVGIAGGVWLLGTGAANADDSVTAAKDPQLHGLLDDFFTPIGGPDNGGLSLDSLDQRMPDQTGLPKDAAVGAAVPAVLGSLPIHDATGTSGLGGLGMAAPASVVPGLLPVTDGESVLPTRTLTDAPLLALVRPDRLLAGLPVPGSAGSGVPDVPAQPATAKPVVHDGVIHVVPRDLSGDDARTTGPAPGEAQLETLPSAVPSAQPAALPVGGDGVRLPTSDLPLVGDLVGGRHRAGRGLTGTGLPVVDGLGGSPARSAERPVAPGVGESHAAAGLPGIAGIPVLSAIDGQVPVGNPPIFGAVSGGLPISGGLDGLPVAGTVPGPQDAPGRGRHAAADPDDVVTEAGALPTSRGLPTDAVLPVKRATKKALPAKGGLLTHGALPANGGLPTNGALPTHGALPANGGLPANGALPAPAATPFLGSGTVDQAALSDLPIFGSVARKAADAGGHSLPTPGHLLH